MSLIQDLAAPIFVAIRDVLPEIHATDDATTIKAALSARKTVAWIGAPETITLNGPNVGIATWEVALISPEHTNHIKGIDDLTAAALTLAAPLGVTEMTPDTATLGAGPTFPALFIHFEHSFTLED